MKGLLSTIAVSFFLLCFTVVKGQAVQTKADSLKPLEPFEGVIGYHIEYKEGNVPGVMELLPDSMSISIKYPWIRAKWFGGMSDTLMNDAVWYATTNDYYLLDHNQKIVYLLPPSEDSTELKAAKSKDTARIAGYKCSKYSLKTEKFQETWWLSKNIFIQRSMIDTFSFGRPSFLAAGLNEIPLKSIRKGSEGTVTCTAIKIEKMQLTEADFQYPKEYEIMEFDRLRRHHPLVPE